MGGVGAARLLVQCRGGADMTFSPLVSLFFLGVFTLIGVGLVAWAYLKRPRTASLSATIRRLLMVVAVAFGLAGPAIPVEQEDVVSKVDVVIAVDRTGSMAAEDGPGGAPRLDAVRRDIHALVEGASSARFTVVTWDSSSRVELPATTDSSAVLNFADNLHQEVSEFSTGSTLARPALNILDVLESAAESRPQDRRFLVVLSDGETTTGEGNALGSGSELLDQVAGLLDGGAVIGYGTAQGGPMRVYGVGGVGVTDEYMVDEDGATAISSMDEGALEGLAETLGVELLINPSETSMRALGESFLEGAGTVLEGRPKLFTYYHVTWVPALALAALLTWEVASFVRRSRRLRATNAI